MPANFQVKGSDLGDLFIPRDLFTQGGLWGWGYNLNGQLGDNTIIRKSSPVQTVAGGITWKLVAGGSYHTAAIKTDGTLWTWGRNTFGQIGVNDTTNRSSPVQTVSAGTNWKQVAPGWNHTAAIKTDGTLWIWGRNDVGALGDNTITHLSSPIQTIAGGTNWKQVSGGAFYTSAIKTDGTLWAWGANDVGQLGDNTQTHRSSPVQIIGSGTNWKQVSCGLYHTGAIKTDGTLWMWGYNTYGELGINATTPDRVSSPIQTIAAGTNWKQVIINNRSTVAVKTDGTLWLWGRNIFGNLGDNTTVPKSSPVQTVAGGTNWKLVAGGGYSHIAATKSDGTLWTWGKNNYGQLGDNTSVNKSSPVQTIAAGTNWKLVSCGFYHVAALTDIY